LAKVVSTATILGTVTFVDVICNSRLGTSTLNTTTGIATFGLNGLAQGTPLFKSPLFQGDNRYMTSDSALAKPVSILCHVLKSGLA
jgi:hypothetical protein